MDSGNGSDEVSPDQPPITLKYWNTLKSYSV